MSIYRNIVAVMAAIVIASPLCCCFLSASDREAAPAGCGCLHESMSDPGCPGGPSCSECGAKNPRLCESGNTAPLKAALPELAPLPILAVAPERAGDVFTPSSWLDLPDPGPPGWRLVFHQTFLI